MSLLAIIQSADSVTVNGTLLAIGGSIFASVVTNYVVMNSAFKNAIAKFEGSTTTELTNVKEDIKEIKVTTGHQWERINIIDKKVVEIQTNCNNKHGNSKAHGN
jgi:hypothetical protein